MSYADELLALAQKELPEQEWILFLTTVLLGGPQKG